MFREHGPARFLQGCVAILTTMLLLAGNASPTSAQAAPGCASGQAPLFALGFAELKQRLTTRMGNPVECEHPDPSTGDIVQHTSTGLAYERAGGGGATFTNGWEHYALVDRDLVLWRNASPSPPQPTAEQAAYVQQTLPLRSHLDQLDETLIVLEQQARTGSLDDVDIATLGGIVDDLATVGDQLDSTVTPSELVPYAQHWVEVQHEDVNAATALVQARLTADPAERATNLADATTQIQARNEAREAATFALSQVCR